MYIIVTLIATCVFAVIVNGIRLSLFLEQETKTKKLIGEERLRQIYRNAYFSHLSLKDEV